MNYDHLFEVSNLATEIISGQRQKMSMPEIVRKINSFKKAQLGNVHISYGEPIGL